MEETKRFELPDEIVEAISGGKLNDNWKNLVRMSVLTYRNFLNRHGEGRARLEDVLADMDTILKNVRTDNKDMSDVEQDRKIIEDYIREIWES